MPSSATLNHRHQPSTTSTTSSTSSTSSTRPALQRILTNSPSNAVHFSRSAAPTSRRVRSHWFTHFAFNWRRSSRTSKLFLAASLVMMALQVVTAIVVLTFSWEMYCDKPLRVFVTVYILRLVLSCPLTVYLHLVPRRRRQANSSSSAAAAAAAANSSSSSNESRGEIYAMTEPVPQPTITATSPLPTVMHRIPRQETVNRPSSDGDTVLTQWIDRAKSALDLFAFLWFIIGNYMLFTSTTCSETAVPLYYFSLVLIVYGYIILTVPILLCTAVIFCLPCVLVGMRMIHVGDAVDMGGASSEEIAKIPVYQFKPNNKPASAVTAATVLASSRTAPSSSAVMEEIEIHAVPQKPTVRKEEPPSGFMDKLWHHLGFKDVSDSVTHEEPVYDTIEIPNEQDQVCAICLSTYESGDILCKLWCNHHFHKTCVHEWLALNSRCPMCKRDCRGKEYLGQDPV